MDENRIVRRFPCALRRMLKVQSNQINQFQFIRP